MKHFKKIRIFILSILLAILTFVISAYQENSFEISKNLDIFYSIVREIDLFYVDKTDPGKLIKTAIDAMLESVDPYTVYIPESQIEDYKFMTTGQYGGVGAMIRKKGDFIVVSEPYENAPAHKAGIIAGDIIKAINGVSVKNKNVSDVSELLRGQPNTTVTVSIERPGSSSEIEKTITREIIQIKSVPYYGMLNDKVGYIKLTQFTENATKEVREAFIELKEKKHAQSIVLDLRGNPGGLLMEAVYISNLFIKKGQLVVSTKGKLSDWNKDYKTSNAPLDETIPLAVLVDRGSASASEIVSGTFQDLDRAVIIGQRTFGKGLVQTTRDLSYNAKLKVTTAKYYIPSGRCIQALDYSNRNEDGSVGKVPDSLISEFKTLKGRKVYDGGGIMPDIETEEELLSKVEIALIEKNTLFDFVTDYCLSHKSIESPQKFEFTDEDYKNFIRYIAKKEFDYTTKTEDAIKSLIELAKKEKYYEHAKEQFDALYEKLEHDLNRDLIIFKDDIINLISEEIISRYYFQKGRIERSLINDKEVKKAIEVLSNPQLYSSILSAPQNENKASK